MLIVETLLLILLKAFVQNIYYLNYRTALSINQKIYTSL